MRITQVLANLVEHQTNNLLAYVNIVFDDVLIIRGIRVVEKQDGSRLMVMPSRMTRAGTYKDICHPLNNDFRATIEVAVMGKVNGMINNKEKK